MKILKIVGGVVAVLVVGVAGAASTKPDTLHVERSATVNATPADVFPFVNDMNKWATWNPWKDRDPNQETAVSENPAGVGAWTSWDGNSEVGKGKMTIKASEENAKVVEDLEFIEPFAGRADVTFTLAAEGDSTKVTWAYDGKQQFMDKVMCLFMDMDKMLGGDFEAGLTNLAKVSEEAAATRKKAEEEAAAAAAAAMPADGSAPVDGSAATPVAAAQ
jgi:hypothetical protein